MKKLLLIGAAFLLANVAQAQCTPDGTLIADAFGVYPDTTQNFAIAEVGTPYNQVLHFKAPTSAGDIDPTLAAFTITSFTVTDVEGIPPGLDYACNVSSCQYAGGSTGCAAITGTPTEVGTYEITINVTAVITILGNNTNYPATFSGYRIHVVPAGTASIQNWNGANLAMYPNPVQTQLTIQDLKQFTNVSAIKVVNIEGKTMQTMDIDNLEMVNISTGHLQSGIYFVEIQHANGVERRRFIKD